MFHKIKIAKREFNLSWAYDYSFATIQGKKEDLIKIAEKMHEAFLTFDLDLSSVPHIRLFSDVRLLAHIK